MKNTHDPQTHTRTADATVTYHVETNRLSLQSLLDTALDRALAAERERDALKEQVNELKIEMLKLKQDIARHSAGMLRLVWSPEKIVEWAEGKPG